MWQRADYERAAQTIGKDYAASWPSGTTTINQLATKTARDNNLTPEGIRTMVRLANVAVFEDIFPKYAGSDKMFEFEVGDPEVVINNLYNETKTAMDRSLPGTQTDYDRQQDYYGDLNTPFTSFDKEAAAPEPVSEISVPKHILREKLLQAREKLALEKQEHEFEWVDALEKAARLMAVAAPPIPACITLEKDAVSTVGEGITPELTVLREMTGRCTKHAFLGGEKVAHVLEHHVANPSADMRSIIEMLKEAQSARQQIGVCRQGLEWLANNLPRVS